MLKNIIYVLSVGLVLLCGSSQSLYFVVPAKVTSSPAAKNIILLIGDGMGLAHITASMYENENSHPLEKFPIIGFHKTHSLNGLVTDSAAGATAFACGIKTNNNTVGMDGDTVAHTNIIELAELHGLSTGLVVTSKIVHATPAAFVAHVPQRTDYEDIAADFLNVEIDYWVGGGMKYFNNRETDNRDLHVELLKKKYTVGNYFDHDILNFSSSPKENFAFFTAYDDPVPTTAGRKYLRHASKRGMQFLEKHDTSGFFLMIEGSQIDWAAHSNEYTWMMAEIRDFNLAIEAAYQFARKRGNTLVLVTADHETGGFAINPGSKIGKIEPGFTNNNHTATMIPIFAYGPSAELFRGIYENTEINNKMIKALNISKEPIKNRTLVPIK